MTSVIAPVKEYSIHSSDVSFKSASSVERQALQYQADVERFLSPALARQRVQVSEGKLQEQATLAVCAKIERAVGRRFSLQDAEFTKKVNNTIQSPPSSSGSEMVGKKQ